MFEGPENLIDLLLILLLDGPLNVFKFFIRHLALNLIVHVLDLVSDSLFNFLSNHL